jgi:hypothetical protein
VGAIVHVPIVVVGVAHAFPSRATIHKGTLTVKVVNRRALPRKNVVAAIPAMEAGFYDLFNFVIYVLVKK